MLRGWARNAIVCGLEVSAAAKWPLRGQPKHEP